MAYRLDIKDSINRIKSVGKLVSLHEESNFAKIANALLSMERARLDEAVESTKKHLGDWAGAELDNWWGTILSLSRLPGVESEEEFIGDATYISRIKRFMEAGNMGISLEATRMAAEAGGGVPFKINKAGNRIILIPMEALTPAAREGAMRAVRRLAPARSIVEVGDAETYGSSKFTHLWSDSVYVGEDPTKVRMDGPVWNSENMLIVATANKWGPAPEGTLSPGDGLPNNLLRNDAWHVPDMGFGERVNLLLGTEIDEVINKVRIIIGTGQWSIQGFVDGEPVFHEDVTSFTWEPYEKIFPMKKASSVELRITNSAQDENSLFVKGAYVGTSVDASNRETWLALGGKEGVNARDEVIISSADNIGKTEWVSQPLPDPSYEVSMYGQIGGSPQKVSGFKMKTRTPGSLFRVSYSNDNIDNYEEYPSANWIDMPGYYKVANGRVDVDTFKAKHVKITFTNLRPMLLKEYHSES